MRRIARRSVCEASFDHEHACIASLSCARLFDRVVVGLAQRAQVVEAIGAASAAGLDVVDGIGRLPAPRHNAREQITPQCRLA
jgi:hypothetical protein